MDGTSPRDNHARQSPGNDDAKSWQRRRAHLASVLDHEVAPIQALQRADTMAPVVCEEHIQDRRLEHVERLVGTSSATGAGARVTVNEGQPVQAAFRAAHHQLGAVRTADAPRPATFSEDEAAA